MEFQAKLKMDHVITENESKYIYIFFKHTYIIFFVTIPPNTLYICVFVVFFLIPCLLTFFDTFIILYFSSQDLNKNKIKRKWWEMELN